MAVVLVVKRSASLSRSLKKGWNIYGPDSDDNFVNRLQEVKILIREFVFYVYVKSDLA